MESATEKKSPSTPSRSLAEVSKASYYVQNEIFSFDEDERNEFKMHLSFTEEEIPAACKGRRRAISRAINGFLNTGKGGTVFLGVEDRGEVLGIALSAYQREHIQVVLEDLCQRYNPPIPSCLLKLMFTPVISSHTAQVPNNKDKTVINSQPHLTRTAKNCWCKTKAHALSQKGFIFPRYVIEIEVKPTSSFPISIPGPVPMLKPIFLDENGKCFARRAASVWQICYQDVLEMTIADITQYYTSLKEKYLADLAQLTADWKAQKLTLSPPPTAAETPYHQKSKEFVRPSAPYNSASWSTAP